MEITKALYAQESFRISLSVVVIIVCTLVLVRVLKRLLYAKENIEHSTWKPLRFYSSLLFGGLYFIGGLLCVYMIPPLRDLSLSILASSGVLAIIIGFAGQQALANVVSGCFIAIFKPFRVGDKVKFIGREVSGTVEDITLRHTIIRTFENKMVIIPNSVVSVDIIENAHILEEKICRFFEIGISYDSDHNKAIRIIQEEVKEHPDYFDNRTPEDVEQGIDPVKVRILGFADSSIVLRAWVWAKDNGTGFDMACDLNKSVKERFDREGIEIPFPHRTIVYKNAGFKDLQR